MKLLIKPYFVILCLIYFATRYLKSTDLILPIFIKNHLTDLLCMPIILTICLVGVRLIRRLPNYVLNPFMIFSMTVFYAVIFEYLAPKSNPNQTGDWIDVGMYVLGGLGYWVIQRRVNLDRCS
jgi:hypothetical protein